MILYFLASFLVTAFLANTIAVWKMTNFGLRIIIRNSYQHTALCAAAAVGLGGFIFGWGFRIAGAISQYIFSAGGIILLLYILEGLLLFLLSNYFMRDIFSIEDDDFTWWLLLLHLLFGSVMYYVIQLFMFV